MGQPKLKGKGGSESLPLQIIADIGSSLIYVALKKEDLVILGSKVDLSK